VIDRVSEAMRRLEEMEDRATMEMAAALVEILRALKPRLEKIAEAPDRADAMMDALRLAEELRTLLRDLNLRQAGRILNIAHAASLEAVRAIEGGFGHLSPSALTAAAVLAGYMPSSGPSEVLRYLARYGDAAVEAFRRELLTAIGTGAHPDEMARALRRSLGISLARASTLARTEMMRAWRTGFYAWMDRAGDVIVGWQWTAKMDRLTCPACAMMHGRVFRRGEWVHGHPNCRCVPIPIPSPALPFYGVEPVLVSPLHPADLAPFLPPRAREAGVWPRLLLTVRQGPFGLQVSEHSVRRALEEQEAIRSAVLRGEIQEATRRLIRALAGVELDVPVREIPPGTVGPWVPGFTAMEGGGPVIYLSGKALDGLRRWARGEPAGSLPFLVWVHEAHHAIAFRSGRMVPWGFGLAVEEIRTHLYATRFLQEVEGVRGKAPESVWVESWSQTAYLRFLTILFDAARAAGEDPWALVATLDQMRGLDPMSAFLIFAARLGKWGEGLLDALQKEAQNLVGG
jgi:SPP1 gp7 family putative phage head morphogenesis protein